MSPPPPHVLMSAKSRWHPAVRREHGLAKALVEDGVRVDFVERAHDVRDLAPRRTAARVGAATPEPPAGLAVHPYFTPVPGHRGRVAEGVDRACLRRAVSRVVARRGPPDVVVANAPWNWSGAVGGVPAGTRKVLDVGDDWSTMLPHQRTRMQRLYRRISDEADAVIVVSPRLAALFDRDVEIVPNAVADELLATDPVPAPGDRRMAYVGTLSPRLDLPLLAEVLSLLGDWTLDLYGSCQYPGLGQEPSPELREFLARSGDRARWHGPVDRLQQSAVLDRADVLLIPNDPVVSEGQDPMKLYDYAARGRPIVSSIPHLPVTTPEDLAVALDARAFASAVESASGTLSYVNRRWAEQHSWSHRIGPWLAAALGDGRSRGDR